MTENAIVLAPDRAVEGVQLLANLVNTLYSKVMREGIDYGVIPGTNDKPTLYLPGMEKLMRALNVTPQYVLVHVIRDYDKPLFHYEYECTLVDAETGLPVPGGRAIGLATSAEAKWGWRWVTLHRVPPNLDPTKLVMRGGKAFEFAFAIDKAETTGKYGKPAEYWQMFSDAIASGEAVSVQRETKRGLSPGYEIDMTEYRIPNDAVFDQINTICKIGQKRALASAIKGATNSSELFNIDLEDLVDHIVSRKPADAPAPPKEPIIEGTFTDVTPKPTQADDLGPLGDEPAPDFKTYLCNKLRVKATRQGSTYSAQTKDGQTTIPLTVDQVKDIEVRGQYAILLGDGTHMLDPIWAVTAAQFEDGWLVQSIDTGKVQS